MTTEKVIIFRLNYSYLLTFLAIFACVSCLCPFREAGQQCPKNCGCNEERKFSCGQVEMNGDGLLCPFCPLKPIVAHRRMKKAWRRAEECFLTQPVTCDQKNPTKYYSADGTCNNLKHPTWGKSYAPYARLFIPDYIDRKNKYQMRTTASYPRKIRTGLLPAKEDVPLSNVNLLHVAVGQFITRDVGLTVLVASSENSSCCPNENGSVDDEQFNAKCSPLLIPEDDYYYSTTSDKITCIDIKRADNTLLRDCDVKPIFQLNDQTPWLDLSIVYGRNDDMVRRLRASDDGLLLTANLKNTNGQIYPSVTTGSDDCPHGGLNRITSEPACFLGGDPRVNQNTELFVVYVTFLQLHNLVAAELKNINPQWGSDDVFNEARKITTALYQNMIAKEYLRESIGDEMTKTFGLEWIAEGYERVYDAEENPQVYVEFQAAAGRGGHSTSAGKVTFDKKENKSISYEISKVLFNIKFVLQKDTFMKLIDAYANSQCRKEGQYFSKELTDLLAVPMTAPVRVDLATLDIIRGRDFGVLRYNDIRQKCGLCRFDSFEDWADYITDSERNIEKAKELYEDMNDVDYYVGGLLEKPIDGAMVGPSFACIIAQSFRQWKISDRLYYSSETAGFTPDQLNYIREFNLSNILCLTNPSLERVPTLAFRVPSDENPFVNCEESRTLDLHLWHDSFERSDSKSSLEIDAS